MSESLKTCNEKKGEDKNLKQELGGTSAYKKGTQNGVGTEKDY